MIEKKWIDLGGEMFVVEYFIDEFYGSVGDQGVLCHDIEIRSVLATDYEIDIITVIPQHLLDKFEEIIRNEEIDLDDY